MPRINAANLAEHVAHQEHRLFQEAVRQFTERGYANVTYGDIADAVGLARNSLYRYFPRKVDILTRWSEQELARQMERSRACLLAPGDPYDRIMAWVDDQLDYARRPQHRLLAAMESIEPELTPTIRRQLAESHDALLDPLRAVLEQCGAADPVQRDAAAALVHGQIMAAARYESRGGDRGVMRDAIARSITAIIAVRDNNETGD